jgi:hypothetical protein
VKTRADRTAIGRKRLVSVLKQHTICLGRTLEQKIADAGPYNQRIDPHILTECRRELIKLGRVVRLQDGDTPWFHLNDASKSKIEQRLKQLKPIHAALRNQSFVMRLGQALEIAVYRSFASQHALDFFGTYPDLDAHDDSKLYKKEEPPSSISGKSLPNDRKLDFIARHPSAGWAGLEVKNIREWLYLDRQEITDLLSKCLHLDIVPVLIGRRIPYVTRRVLQACGALIWETYNQRYPAADVELAQKAKNKDLLGYHDIKLGNDPGPHLEHFITTILADELSKARERFDTYRDILESYVYDGISYNEFTARVRRREQGDQEDHDWSDGP